VVRAIGRGVYRGLSAQPGSTHSELDSGNRISGRLSGSLLGVKLLRKIIPREVLDECRQRADTVEAQKKEDIKSAAATFGVAAVLSLWFLGMIASLLLMLKYVRH
jgi:hypothetical protein